ncbi:MAG TPA: hypothetical protein VGM90_10055 [Kofleriaceae bacterium]
MGRFALVALWVASLGCRAHFDELPPTDGGGSEGEVDPSLAHVNLAAGWKIRVYRDFSEQFTYDATDFVDGTETYDNQPSTLEFLSAPFPDELVVSAGRSLLELTDTAYRNRTYGSHAPDTAGLPDSLRCPQLVADLNGMPGILVSSSSLSNGDGTFIVRSDFGITLDKTVNNTRCAIWDADGTFDGRGTAEAYLATNVGLQRRSDGVNINTADHETIAFNPSRTEMIVSRYDATGEMMDLISIASGGHAETMLAHSTFNVSVGSGALAGTNGWATIDLQKLYTIGDGTLTLVAESTDADWLLHAVGTPPAGHVLDVTPNGTAYLVESNRTLDIDRILLLEKI